jgi:hypothetical protein
MVAEAWPVIIALPAAICDAISSICRDTTLKGTRGVL